MKKLVLILMLLASGCSSDRIQPFTFGSLWGRPDIVTIQKGDTLYSISKKYDVQLRDLIETNNLRPPYTLSIGQVLMLPAARYHIVEKGDTLYSISKRYNVDLTTLSRTNNLQPPYTLSIGQKLELSASVVNTPAPAPAVSAKPTPKTSASAKPAAPKLAAKPAAKSTPVSTSRKAKFAWPVKGKIISPFGTIAKGRNNDGINIQAPRGADVKAADAGTIAYAGNELKGFGSLILIRHSDGWITAYAHNDRLMVKKGQKVVKGEKIATVGSSGGVGTPQLHFEIRAGKNPVNPVRYLP